VPKLRHRGILLAGVSQIIGTIKSQGQIDGKFRANVADTSLKCLLFFSTAQFMGGHICSFWCDPEPQAKRDQGDGADASEPEHRKPQQTLHQRRWIWLDLRQW
jgi:hypothetical protein